MIEDLKETLLDILRQASNYKNFEHGQQFYEICEAFEIDPEQLKLELEGKLNDNSVTS